MEFVYKLDLPQLPDILLESVHSKVFNKSRWSWDFADGYLRPEWANWKDFKWSYWLQFYRDVEQGTEIGKIHTDKKPDHRSMNQSPWGINWMYGGQGIMDYWLFEDLVETTLVQNRTENGVVKPTTIVSYDNPHNVPPRKSYVMPPGAYLVNADYPHRGIGYSNRYNFALRCDEKLCMPWDDVIQHFSDHIIPWD